MLKQYIKNIFYTEQQGDAREESFYYALSELISTYASENKLKTLHVTTLPKKTEGGNPDFRVWDGKQKIIGYIEAKKPGTDLRDVEDTEQLQRYLATFPNVLLTNFYEFRLYRDGKLINNVQIARSFISKKLKTPPPVEKVDEFNTLIDQFLSYSLDKKYNAESLARELAKRTRFMERIVEGILVEDKKEETELSGFYKAFSDYLLSGITKKQFADLYSQTISYGLFAARTRTEGEFNRKKAFDNIPNTIGILRDMFRYISLGDPPKQIEWIVDDIAEVLSVADTQKILETYFHEGKGKDPIVHFYETFLSTYDPKLREKRGVYYTIEPVVLYIIKSVHIILKQVFGKTHGLADNSVTLLDPASGTLTFVAEGFKISLEEFIRSFGEGGKRDFVREHLLKNFYAFEIMMAPYVIGHLKIGFILDELGYRMTDNERFKLYLTNTLEMEELQQTTLPGMASLSKESHEAGKIKKSQPILVVVGNPPYSVSSVNKSEFIENKMKLYKEDVKNERNIQPLSDDYVKFIRFSQWKIDENGSGVIGMITNNSYLSGLIHRGMRKELLKSFDEIYILNLHGNARIGERSPDGSRDENVFDIMQGVSIALFVKAGNKSKLATVYYQDLFGTREEKYKYLEKNDVNKTKWEKLEPSEPYYFFIKKDFTEKKKYDKFVSLTKIFNNYSSGVKTHRDHFIVGFNKDEVEQRMKMFTSSLPDEAIISSLKLKDTRDWKLSSARLKIKAEKWTKHITKYSYRPFDTRYICYSPILIDRGSDRWELMRNLLEDNLALVSTRRTPDNFGNPSFVCTEVGDIHLIGDQNYYFPLYIMENENIGRKGSAEALELFKSEINYKGKSSNIKPDIIALLNKIYKNDIEVRDTFSYIYAVLYSTLYQNKYTEFLKIDFPSIPFTSSYKIFKIYSGLGSELLGDCFKVS